MNNKLIKLLITLSMASIFSVSSGCAVTNSLVNPKPDDSLAKQRIVDLLDSFEKHCLDKDLVSRPSPKSGSEVFSKFNYVIGDENGKITRSCNFWSWRLGRFNNFDRNFITYYQHSFFISEIKKRFGVIYHSVANVLPGTCSSGKLHTMLLRDGETAINILFAHQDHSAMYCDKNYGQGYALSIRRLDLWGDKKPDSYIVSRDNVINLDRLSDDEKISTSEKWDSLSVQDKEAYTKSISDRMDSIRRLHAHYYEQYSEITAGNRETKRFLEQKKQESRDHFNKVLTNAIISSVNTNNRSSNTGIPASRLNTYNRPAVTPNAFKNQKGFDVRQLPENINRSQIVSSKPTSSSGVRTTQKAASTQASKPSNPSVRNEKSKVYEPMPTTKQATTDMWHSGQEYTLALTRLKAANKVTAECRAKGARIDSITYSQIEANSPPARWSFSSPNCRQGGFNGKEWKCDVSVSGTCFRMQ